MVFNHTCHQIVFDAARNLCVDGSVITNFSDENCKIIAYHIKDHFDTIWVEQKDNAAKNPEKRFYIQGKWSQLKLKSSESSSLEAIIGSVSQL